MRNVKFCTIYLINFHNGIQFCIRQPFYSDSTNCLKGASCLLLHTGVPHLSSEELSFFNSSLMGDAVMMNETFFVQLLLNKATSSPIDQSITKCILNFFTKSDIIVASFQIRQGLQYHPPSQTAGVSFLRGPPLIVASSLTVIPQALSP